MVHALLRRVHGRLFVGATALLAPIAPAAAQRVAQADAPTQTIYVNRANWALADRFSTENMRNLTGSTSVNPRWLGETDSLWYNWRDTKGTTFYLVVPAQKLKKPLFDHLKMAAELSRLHRKPYEPNRLPFTTLNFTKDHKKFRFIVDSSRYEWSMLDQSLTQIPKLSRDSVARDEEGASTVAASAPPEFRAWSPDSTAFAFARDHNLYLFEKSTGDTIQLTKDGEKKYSFGFRDTTAVTEDSTEGQGGGRGGRGGANSKDPRVRANVNWSLDSKFFTVSRSDSRLVKELYLVNNLANPRPTLTSYPYDMPGESEVAKLEVFLYQRGAKELKRAPVEKWRDQRVTDIDWPVKDSGILRFIRRDRLQRNLELVELNTATMATRVLLTESVEDAQLEIQGVRYVTRGGDFIWFSERSGWGHYYLYSFDGTLKRPLTSGPWRASTIVAQDTIKGTIFVGGNGREEGPSPYLRDVYRMNGDGSGFLRITDGALDHAVTVSPTRKYAIDNYSRADVIPAASLRDAVTGKVIMELERMDDSRLKEMGWAPPEPFVTKAADGVTDIYGNLRKPIDFDSTKKYPIIAYVYPGPQMEAVTSGFSTGGTMQQLAQLGFIVIEIGNRGGTPLRSNAYHSFGYYNLRDYALADKKTGIEQLAARYPWIDLNRVGIYGHSGGGFLTAAALMLPPYNDFFKVGVSSSGNHDNNIYNLNWSESNNGLKVIYTKKDTTKKDTTNTKSTVDTLKTQVRNGTRIVTIDDTTRWEIRVATNIELAEGLKGRLLLVTGDMDNNVHPANTIRLVDALIRANKRFDFMLMPGKPHGYGSMQPYFNRMLMEYFAEHLMGDYYRGSAEISKP